jgi:hypothetical protein
MKSPLCKELTTIDGNIITVSKKSLIAPPSATSNPMVTDISYEIFGVIKSNVLVNGDLDDLADWWRS